MKRASILGHDGSVKRKIRSVAKSQERRAVCPVLLDEAAGLGKVTSNDIVSVRKIQSEDSSTAVASTTADSAGSANSAGSAGSAGFADAAPLVAMAVSTSVHTHPGIDSETRGKDRRKHRRNDPKSCPPTQLSINDVTAQGFCGEGDEKKKVVCNKQNVRRKGDEIDPATFESDPRRIATGQKRG